MAFQVKVPAVGESVQEGEIYKWHCQSGDYINIDDVLVEIETDKATVDIVAEASGTITIKKNEGDTVVIGEILAEINAEAPQGRGVDSEKKTEDKNNDHHLTAKATAQPLSPSVRRIVSENEIDPAIIDGTGRGGRVTKGDVIEYMAKGTEKPSQRSEQVSSPLEESKENPLSVVPNDGIRGVRREKMSRLRLKIAENLVKAKQTTAMLTTFNEIDMSEVIALRKAFKEPFKEKHGIGLGFMSFFVKAAVTALENIPAINGYIEGKEIVFHDYYDIGVAVSTERGLMVPVVRNCDSLSFAQVEHSIADYAKKGREGKISIDDLTGGTFTISNGGTFGSLLSTPILNPPQSAILGMHKIEKRAVVIDDQIVIRPMMYVALSYDHRIVDGKEAVGFLVKIKDMIENPSRLLLGV